jgi:single-stranded-DNA-specific exonuclease
MTPHPKHWQVAPPAPPSHLTRLGHLSPIIVQVLYNRGLSTLDDVDVFLNAQEDTTNPFGLPDMGVAVTRIRQALRAREPIVVYGDFDADGVTATVLLVQTLQALGAQVRPYIPHRVDEGYGLHQEALTQLADDGARLIVTVDCGVRSLEEIVYANHLGLDIVITDHHSVGQQLPDAVAVIDPKRSDSNHPFKELAGVGVAYRLAQALLRSHRETPVTKQELLLEEDDLLDLVALGTVADLVPLMGENRILVQRGLRCINRMERPGIDALCRNAGIRSGAVDATSIGFALGPRLNAAGRVAHAKNAYQLLDTTYPAEAERLASRLGQLNRQRQQLTLKTQERARQLALEASGDSPLLFAASPDFLAGIVGLAASRLVDEFYRPAIVVEMGEDTSRGSARSIPEFHITEALDDCSDLLVQYGGHAAAAGFTVRNNDIDILASRLRELASRRLTGIDLTPVLSVDAEVKLTDMSWDLQRALAELEPCGYGNPHPLFLSRNVRVTDHRSVGNAGKHLKLTLSDGWNTWDGIAFNQGEWTGKLPDLVDIVYHLEINEWNSLRRLQLNVQDIRPTGETIDVVYPGLGHSDLGEG